jgi:hypothetical protein
MAIDGGNQGSVDIEDHCLDRHGRATFLLITATV